MTAIDPDGYGTRSDGGPVCWCACFCGDGDAVVESLVGYIVDGNQKEIEG